jgi:hypothetical protein
LNVLKITEERNIIIGDSLNNGILLSKLNCVKDEMEKENGNRRVFERQYN